MSVLISACQTELQASRRRPHPGGFTLLEVLLTLSLAVVLIGLVGGALRFYAIDMNVRDMDIRQTQLASAVMQMLENDLRATVHSEPLDTSGLEALLASVAPSAGGGVAQSAGSGDQDLSAAGIDSGDSSTTTDDTTDDDTLIDDSTATTILQTPGLIGNEYQIQIDLSRLPRLEEYAQIIDEAPETLDDIPSDLKTVTYFVQPPGTLGAVADPLDGMSQEGSSTSGGGGLVRRSLDRAATVYAAGTGALASLNSTGQVLAPEILAIEFSYWDGYIWQPEWSSDTMGELPLAVQIRLYMPDPETMLSGDTAASLVSSLDPDTTRVFAHIVRLPLARVIEQEETVTDTETSETTGL